MTDIVLYERTWQGCTESWPKLHPTPLLMNHTTNCEPGVLRQNQCPTSLMLLWLNESKALQQGSKTICKTCNQKSGETIVMPLGFGLKCAVIIYKYPHNFDHILHEIIYIHQVGLVLPSHTSCTGWFKAADGNKGAIIGKKTHTGSSHSGNQARWAIQGDSHCLIN